ncbi:MAG TPA: LytTR family DNA-binding domain-containing protein [Casimicrobiaceae bacterium]|nr:LytTR family DNA-binding domain-containing protein [Casimicrobiaceae bacterium]
MLSILRERRPTAGHRRAPIALPGLHVRAATDPAHPPPLERIAIRSLERIVIVRVQTISRLEADGNYVRIRADRMYLHKETLGGLCDRLDPRQFLRVHRSHAVRLDCVRGLVPQMHEEFLLRLANGVEILSGRSYRGAIRDAFGLPALRCDAAES